MSDTDRVQVGQKRLLSSASEESDISVCEESKIKPEKKRLNFERDCDSADMGFQDALEDFEKRLEKRLDKLATKEDLGKIRQEMKTLTEKFMQRMNELEGRVFEAETKLDKTQADILAEKKKTDELRNVVRHQDRRIHENERSINDLQQYSRRWNLRVYRVPETEGETAEDCTRKVCQVFTESVGVNTKSEDIEVAHRSGKRSSDRPRPILVRFFDRKKRDMIIANRRKLKNKGTVIDEDLTFANYQLSTKAFKHSATMSVWSSNGRVMARLKNGLILRLNIHMDLDEAFRRAMSSNTISDVEEG